MKAFNRTFAAVLIIIAAVFAGTNLYLKKLQGEEGRSYRVEAERAASDIAAAGLEQVDMSRYPTLVSIVGLTDEGGQREQEFFEGDNEDYLIRKIDGIYYRFSYQADDRAYQKHIIKIVNLSLAAISVIVFAVLIFIRVRLVGPFYQLQEVPYELAKGNLTAPQKEGRNQFFGRFLWGVDLLRENLEQQKEERMEMQKEKKTLILSLSHDIKTPLSAIKLYAKALSKNLYDNPDRQREIADNINAKADQIEGFVTQIIEASRDDFLKLSVEDGEIYVSQIVHKIEGYYKEKLEFLKIGFQIDKYTDCIVKGDGDRAVEVLQNIMENAVKYGDGHWIRITFDDEENCRLITVSNSGCTLPDSEMPHIFDSFWRGSNTGSSGGSGLGLYICRQLMQKMGGEIFAVSENGEMKVTVVFTKV